MQHRSAALDRPVWWAVDRVVVRRKVLAIAPKYEFFDPDGRLLLYCHQKLFRLREDIRAYADRDGKHLILHIRARNIIDFSAAYDVVDAQRGEKVGALRRRGWRSLVRDTWEILDADDQPIGRATEAGWAWLRRLVGIVPQRYEIATPAGIAGTVRRSWNPFVYKAEVDFSMDPQRTLDRRLGMAAVLLLMAIEGRQGE
ncbi:MAG: hypothetical protein D6689_08535 [Deltaproteobacteria bacterium]|nr:MAG: hypothetical protein D6689_08535 [Deltaproteobacteria bacterium]